jgi:hypothetical protein
LRSLVRPPEVACRRNVLMHGRVALGGAWQVCGMGGMRECRNWALSMLNRAPQKKVQLRIRSIWNSVVVYRGLRRDCNNRTMILRKCYCDVSTHAALTWRFDAGSVGLASVCVRSRWTGGRMRVWCVGDGRETASGGTQGATLWTRLSIPEPREWSNPGRRTNMPFHTW